MADAHIRRGHIALCAVLALAAGVAVASPRVVSVQPARDNGLLICSLTTSGLPGERIVSTLRSGLVSAVEVRLEVFEDDGRKIVGNRISLLLSFDLWEEVYTVSLEGHESRFRDLEELRGYLSNMPSLPVAPLDVLDTTTPSVVRAGLRLHSIAPDTRGRMEEMISGGGGTTSRPGDAGQEVSVSLGRLIRFFYKGGATDEDVVGTAESAPFLPGELRDAAH